MKTKTLTNWEYLAVENALEQMLERSDDSTGAYHKSLVTLVLEVRAGDKFKLVTNS